MGINYKLRGTKGRAVGDTVTEMPPFRPKILTNIKSSEPDDPYNAIANPPKPATGIRYAVVQPNSQVVGSAAAAGYESMVSAILYNFLTLEKAVKEAAAYNVQLITFNELSLSGYEFGELDPENPDSEMDDAILKLVKDTADHLEEHLYPAGGKISKLAEEHNMVIVATGPMCCSDPMGREGYYDGAVVFHPDGTVDPRRVFKVNLWGYSERNWFRNPHFGDNFSEDASKSAFHVFEANEFPFSVGICFDADFPENSRCMALNGSFLNCFPTASPSVILPGQTEPYPDIREHHIPANSLQNQNFCSYGNRAQYEYVKTGENEYTCVLEYDGNSVITNPYGGQLVAAPDKGQYILIADCVICDYPSTQPPGVNYMTNRRPEVYGLLTAPTVPFPHGSPNGYTYETPVPDGKEPEVPPHDYPSVCPVPLTGSGE